MNNFEADLFPPRTGTTTPGQYLRVMTIIGWLHIPLSSKTWASPSVAGEFSLLRRIQSAYSMPRRQDLEKRENAVINVQYFTVIIHNVKPVFPLFETSYNSWGIDFKFFFLIQCSTIQMNPTLCRESFRSKLITMYRTTTLFEWGEGESSRGFVAKMPDCNIVVSKFESQSR